MPPVFTTTHPAHNGSGISRELDVERMLAMAQSLYRSGPAVRRKIQHLRPYICPFDVLVPLVPDTGSVLDIGCGSGLFLGLAVLLGKNVEAVGLDTSEPALELAREMCRHGLRPEQAARLTFESCRRIEDWPARTFDFVSLIDVMHHVPLGLRDDFFRAVISRVKPGGTLLYKDMRRRPRWKAFLNRCHDLALAHEWVQYCPITQIEGIARHSGLVEMRAEVIQRLWYSHDLRLYRREAGL